MDSQSRNETKNGILLVIIAAVMWAFSGTVGQVLSQNMHFEPLWIVTVRINIAGIILMIISLIKNGKDVFRIFYNKKHLLQIILFSILGNAIMQFSYFAAISASNAATATILQYLSPVVIIISGIVISKKKPSKIEMICTILAVTGTFFIGTHGSLESLALSPQALIWGLISAVSLAFYSVYPVKLMKIYGTSVILTWAMIFGGLFLSIYSNPIGKYSNISMDAIFQFALLIIFGTVIAFLLYSIGVGYIGGGRANMLATIEPVSSAIISYFLFHTSFMIYDYIGFICILAITLLLGLDGVPVKNKNDTVNSR